MSWKEYVTVVKTTDDLSRFYLMLESLTDVTNQAYAPQLLPKESFIKDEDLHLLFIADGTIDRADFARTYALHVCRVEDFERYFFDHDGTPDVIGASYIENLITFRYQINKLPKETP